jgi:hypothetical protein
MSDALDHLEDIVTLAQRIVNDADEHGNRLPTLPSNKAFAEYAYYHEPFANKLQEFVQEWGALKEAADQTSSQQQFLETAANGDKWRDAVQEIYNLSVPVRNALADPTKFPTSKAGGYLKNIDGFRKEAGDYLGIEPNYSLGR